MTGLAARAFCSKVDLGWKRTEEQYHLGLLELSFDPLCWKFFQFYLSYFSVITFQTKLCTYNKTKELISVL